MIVIGVLPFVVMLGFALAAGLVIGLPLTWLLRRADLDGPKPYGLAGIIFGAGIPAIAFGPLNPNGLLVNLAILCPLGAIAGGVTGWYWGRFRQSL